MMRHVVDALSRWLSGSFQTNPWRQESKPASALEMLMISHTRSIPLFLLLALPGLSAADEPQAEVMLFGVFHFANPGKDLVKSNQINVMTPDNQAYLERLAKRIAEFRPTVVLLEFDPENERDIQERYRQYLGGDADLSSNEVYQLGFRIASEAGLTSIHSFDEREVHWDAEPLFEYMPENDPETNQKMNEVIAKIAKDREVAHRTKTLAELLQQANDPEWDGLNKYLYLMTNHVGAGENFVGADAAASWWRRNFRMYAKIQTYAHPGERILAIGGQGHTAILKDLLALDMDRTAVDVRPFIADQ
jgi:hypothetical protein